LIPDQEILALFRNPATKEKGFTLLMQEYQQTVYWMIRRMVLDHEEANDLTQDTFVKVWHNMDGFREESKLFSWIYRIAANEALGYLRKQKIQRLIPFSSVEYKVQQDLQDDRFFSGDEIQQKLQAALNLLPPRQKMIFNMRYYEDLSYEQIAEILGLSVGALKASYHHAVKKIENKLTGL
jgi:RNA polymerase sigma-70 factor (ECF subfamily)